MTTELGLAPGQLTARAKAFVPELIERQAETERRTRYAADTHEAFRSAGFYRVSCRVGTAVTRDPGTFATVIKELARGCPSTAWCVCLAAHHAVRVATWFPEDVQAEAFGDGDFRCPSGSAPTGTVIRVPGGWRVVQRSVLLHEHHDVLDVPQAGAAAIGWDRGRASEALRQHRCRRRAAVQLRKTPAVDMVHEGRVRRVGVED